MSKTGFDFKAGKEIKTDVNYLDMKMKQVALIEIAGANIPALSADAVLSSTALTAAIQNITSGITNPGHPRGVSIVGSEAGIVDDIVITGTNYNGDIITETITLNGTSTVNGNKAFKTITNIALPVQTHTPTKQVESQTVTHAADIGGTLVVTITAAGMTGTPKAVNVPVLGTLQVETGTVVGSVTGDGNAEVIVTAVGMTGTPKTIPVAVLNGDTASDVGGKIRTALGSDGDVSGFFTISGSGADVVLTSKVAAANDATMNISIDNDTCTGLTPAPTSANTTAGVAFDTINEVATKVRAALTNDADVGAFFTVSGADENIVLTAKLENDNDATMEIALTDADSTGVTFGSSTNTTAGVNFDLITVGLNDKLGLPYKLTRNTILQTFLNDVLEGTAPTLAKSATVLESNTLDLNSALDGNDVDIYLIV